MKYIYHDVDKFSMFEIYYGTLILYTLHTYMYTQYWSLFCACVRCMWTRHFVQNASLSTHECKLILRDFSGKSVIHVLIITVGLQGLVGFPLMQSSNISYLLVLERLGLALGCINFSFFPIICVHLSTRNNIIVLVQKKSLYFLA